MKLNKKLNLFIVFAIGAILFTGAAFAEVRTPSGYEQLKEALKISEDAENNLNNYTRTTKATIKHNDKVIMENIDTEKYDNVKGASEYSSETLAMGLKIESSYSYEDDKQDISYYSDDDTWYVREKSDMPQKDMYEGYYEDYYYEYESTEKALERLMDAAVSAFNLQNVLNAEKDSDGNTVLIGHLTEGQIHPFINALFSFLFTQTYNYNFDMGRESVGSNYPKFDGDVYIKSASARIVLNEDKSIKSANLSAVISGRDVKGNYHDLKFETEMNTTDINKTVVNAPDLTGKNVVYEKNDWFNPNVSKAYIGKYSCDIVQYKDESFTKVGERYLEITDIDGQTVKGKIYSIKDGEETDAMEFEAISETGNYAEIIKTDSAKKDFHGSLFFNDNGTVEYYDYDKDDFIFIRIFD